MSYAKSGLAPKDMPEGKLPATQSELTGLQKQENEILSEIDRQAYEQNPSAWPQQTKPTLIRRNIAAAQEQAEADAAGKCPDCVRKNAEEVKFCRTRREISLAAARPKYCTSCGAESAPGARFCGKCGAKQGE